MPRFTRCSPSPSSHAVFAAIHYAGAAYLCRLGVALFPQCIHDGNGPAALQVLILGAIFVSLGFVYLGLGGWAAASGSD